MGYINFVIHMLTFCMFLVNWILTTSACCWWMKDIVFVAHCVTVTPLDNSHDCILLLRSPQTYSPKYGVRAKLIDQMKSWEYRSRSLSLSLSLTTPKTNLHIDISGLIDLSLISSVALVSLVTESSIWRRKFIDHHCEKKKTETNVDVAQWTTTYNTHFNEFPMMEAKYCKYLFDDSSIRLHSLARASEAENMSYAPFICLHWNCYFRCRYKTQKNNV